MRTPPTFVIALFSVLTIGALATRPSAQTSTSADTQDVVAADSRDAAAVDAAAVDPTARFRRALTRHRPVYRFDSDEQYFPLAVNAITNNTGNRLERDNDAMLARRRADGSGFNIGWLRPNLYPSDDSVLASDKIVERHDSTDTQGDYLRDGRRLYRNRSYRNRIYGHIHYRVNDSGRILGAWLQYWVFYYYNNFHVGPFGNHEGDWEMIQIEVDSNANPRRAAYAQHNIGSVCDWSDVRRAGSGRLRPVVFVGRGSHASYFTAGDHDVPNVPEVADRADGAGTRLSGVHLRTIGDDSPRWVAWPGFWGGTKSTFEQIPTDSPKGPAFQGDKWSDPDAWVNSINDEDHCR